MKVHFRPVPNPCPAPATQAGVLDLVADPLRVCCSISTVPFQTPRCLALEAPVLQAVEVGEDAVFVFENADHDSV